MEEKSSWYKSPRLWLETFVLVNLTFLAPDIYLAHSTNSFRHPAEYVPLVFSLAAPVALVAAVLTLVAWSLTGPWRFLGFLVGWVSVIIGVAGLILHLRSHFFQEETLDNLVYTAPFAAPLSYTGIGLLLIMNRMVKADTIDWPQWVLFLSLGGFIGNFIFSLADHAQNGFFKPAEWISVVSSALAVGFLVVPFFARVNRFYLNFCAFVMIVQLAVGLLGFYYHTTANLHGPSARMFDNFVYGAPPLAPLLFPNLALLAFIGLWVLRRHLPTDDVT